MLVVHDPADEQTRFDASASLAAKRPDTHLVVAQGLGHRGVLDDPEMVARIVQFIADEQMPPASP